MDASDNYNSNDDDDDITLSVDLLSNIDSIHSKSETTIQSENRKFSTQAQNAQHSTVESSADGMNHIILTKKAQMGVKPHLGSNIKDYLTLIAEDNELKTEPEWDSYEKCIMMDLIESKVNNHLALAALKIKRVEQAKNQIEQDKLIKEIEKDELLFGASFAYFDKFVKENNEKRERAINKTETEKAVCDKLNYNIKKTEEQIEKFVHIKNNIETCINDCKIFTDFLEKVRHLAPDLFRNGVSDILERYEVLIMVHEKLEKEHNEALETVQSRMHTITDGHLEATFKLRNKYTELARRFDSAYHGGLYWKSMFNKILDLVADKLVKQKLEKRVCYDLYLDICQSSNLPIDVDKTDSRGQLLVIEEAIHTLRRALCVVKPLQESQSDN